MQAVSLRRVVNPPARNSEHAPTNAGWQPAAGCHPASQAAELPDLEETTGPDEFPLSTTANPTRVCLITREVHATQPQDSGGEDGCRVGQIGRASCRERV